MDRRFEGGLAVYTIGHSTHSLSELLGLLHEAGARCVADVRTVPRSRRVPHFDREALAEELAAAEIAYMHVPELGGWRSPRPGIEDNAGWRNRSFRGYADHMTSEEFAVGLDRLTGVAGERPTAVMCAEAPWWRCHRRLIADALLAQGWEVCHVGPDGRLVRHELTEFAVVGARGDLRYPADGTEQLRL